MDENRLKEIEKRAAKATPGPWMVCHGGSDDFFHGEYAIKTDDRILLECNTNFRSENDTDFIAASRQDVPDLLAEVKLLRGELAEVIGNLQTEIAGSVKYRAIMFDAYNNCEICRGEVDKTRRCARCKTIAEALDV